MTNKRTIKKKKEKEKDTSRFSNAKIHKFITIHKRKSHWFDKKKHWKKIKQT